MRSDRGSRGGSNSNAGPPDISGMHTLKVDNITYRASVEEIRKLFERYGDIGDVYIPRDHRTQESRGFGFVRFFDLRDAEDAMDAMDGKFIDGRELRVQFAERDRPKNPREYFTARYSRDTRSGGGGGGYYGGGDRRGGGGYDRGGYDDRRRSGGSRYRDDDDHDDRRSRGKRRSRSREDRRRSSSRDRRRSRSASPSRSPSRSPSGSASPRKGSSPPPRRTSSSRSQSS